MTKPVPGIKIPYFKTSLYPTVEGTRCLEIRIPDDDSFVPLIGGMMRLLARSFYWEGPQEEKYAKADMWRSAFDETDWEGCMECADVAECIENDEATQAAIAAAIRSSALIQAALQDALAGQMSGVPASSALMNRNAMNNNPTCDLDTAWGHIRHGLVDRSFQRVIDVLEKIELTTDNQEMLAEFLNAIPVIGAAFDVVPVTDMLLWFDNVRNWMKDAFEAGDTTELRDLIACDLFCIYQVDCTISAQQIKDYYQSKAIENAPISSDAFTTMQTIISMLGGSTVDFGESIVYVLVGTQYGFLTLINDWFGVHIPVCNNDLMLGDPSDDWMALCEVCPTCGIEVALLQGTPIGDGWGEAPAPENGQNLVDLGPAYFRRTIWESVSPVTSMTVEYDVTNLGGGSGDNAILRMGDFDITEGWIGGDYVVTPGQSGTIEITSPVPVTKLYADLGYTGTEEGAELYTHNKTQFRILDACE